MNADKSHDEQVARWAEFVRDNPKKWKKHLKPFIDAQFEMAFNFYKRLEETEEGREIAKRLREAKISMEKLK